MIRRPPRPDLTVGLKAFYHYIPLGLVIPEVPEESLPLRIILVDPLRPPFTKPSTYSSQTANPR